jgi:hypothetical protein
MKTRKTSRSDSIYNTCELLLSISLNCLQPTLSSSDFAEAQVDFVPLSLRDVKLQKSDIIWADIGGELWTFCLINELCT